MPFTHPTELSTCRAHGIIVSFILFATGQGRSPRSLHPLRGTTTIAGCVPPFKALMCSSEHEPEWLLINAQTQDACTGAGESVSLPLTSDLAQLLRAEAYLPRFEKKKTNILETQLDGQLLSKYESIPYNGSEDVGHPCTTQRVTYAKN